jgi:hypothetical protein
MALRSGWILPLGVGQQAKDVWWNLRITPALIEHPGWAD